MNYSAEEGSNSEASLVRIYMDLTGATETRARSVFMHVCCADNVVERGNSEDTRWLAFTPTLAPRRASVGPLSFGDSRMRLENAGNAVNETVPDWNTFDAPPVPAAGAS
jgi:hypothetical protein